jgi:catechol 2,3-dioxygenase-like lactoylglutathione lyase family enzyme
MAVETLIFDQVHLGVPDPEQASRWYVDALGARPGDHFDRIWFGKTRIIFLKNEKPTPSPGAAIDHFAISYPDFDEAMERVARAGLKTTTPQNIPPELPRLTFVEDPWGAKIEIVEDSDALTFHHVHLQMPDPAKGMRWYLEHFGGKPGKFKGVVDGIQYGNVWLFIRKGDNRPSAGHTIDHAGWRMPDLLAKADELKAKGLRFSVEPKAGPPGAQAPVWMSFTEDPWGVKIELLQRRGE